jgi:hypothetical protein
MINSYKTRQQPKEEKLDLKSCSVQLDLETPQTSLCKIMDKTGSDKGTGFHNYTKFYHKLFSKLQEKPLNLFELGIDAGRSLRGWAKYFANGNIYGADINKQNLFTEDRIKTYFCDQKNPASINEMFNHSDLKNLLFDIIIDDGCHEYPAYINFLIHA